MQNDAPHVLVDALMSSLLRGIDERYRLPQPVLEAFVDATRAIDDGGELLAVVDSTLRFAYVLAEREQSPIAARALLEASGPLVVRLQQAARQDAGAGRQRVEAANARLQQQKSALDSTTDATGLAPPASGGALVAGRATLGKEDSK